MATVDTPFRDTIPLNTGSLSAKKGKLTKISLGIIIYDEHNCQKFA
jgi:hypothetical protein